MDHQTLVKEDIAAGKDLLAALDENGERVNAAFWIYDSESSEWQLNIGYASSAKSSFDDYLVVRRLLDKHPAIKERLTLSDIRLLRPNDPLVTGLSGKFPGVTPAQVQRWAGPVNGVMLDDVVIYRTAA
jgi:hypothetical protein